MRLRPAVTAAALLLAAGCTDEGSPTVGGEAGATTTTTRGGAGGTSTEPTNAGSSGTTTTGGSAPGISVRLTGGEGLPGPDDDDGTGTAVIRLVPERGEVCYELSVRSIEPATRAHIHRGAEGVAGDVVLDLTPPTGGSSEDCAAATTLLVGEIDASPEDFYVDVHNEAFPNGAVRGQLG